MNSQIALSLGESLKLNNAVSVTGGVDAGKGTSVGSVYQRFSDFLNLLVPVSFVIAGLILFFLLIGGGFSIIASGGNPKTVEGGKKQVTGALIGFLLIFSAYWIIRIIEIITGLKILNPS